MDSGPIVIFKNVPAGLRRAEVRAFVKALSRDIAGGQHFCCLITNDGELRRLNQQFRGKDTPTDVLSFPAPGAESLGDVAVSIQRATDQAAVFGHDIETELRVLILHGVLHLLGHDHESDRGHMRRLETRWRKHFQLPTGLIERSPR